MNDVATVKFEDLETQDASLAIVRAAPGLVIVALSQRSNGDIQVVMPPASARELMEALARALSIASAGETKPKS